MKVRVPRALLVDPLLTDADRRLWAMMRLERNDKTIPNVYSPTRLAQLIHVNRATIYNSINRLMAAGWYEIRYGKPRAVVKQSIKLGPWIDMSLELLICKNLKARDVVMYGLLSEKEFRHESGGKFTYRILGTYAEVCVKTARLAVKALEEAGWLNTHQKRKSQMAPINFALDSPSAKYCRKEKPLTNMRLKRPGGHGESMAMAMVMLVAADGTECQPNTRMSSLPSPDTGEMMEVDIWLPDYKLAIEFNGAQHYNPTSFASAEEVAKQKRRDAAKIAMLKKAKKNVIILTAGDLLVEAIAKKLKGLVPLRDLRFYKRMVDYLNHLGECYRRKAQMS